MTAIYLVMRGTTVIIGRPARMQMAPMLIPFSLVILVISAHPLATIDILGFLCGVSLDKLCGFLCLSLRNRQMLAVCRYSTYLFLFYNKIDIEELISSPNGLNLFGGAAVGAEHM